MPTPPCRICGKPDDVICYPDDPAGTICPTCCEGCRDLTGHADGESGHQFDYERGEGWICRYCGIRRDCTNYVEHYSRD